MLNQDETDDEGISDGYYRKTEDGLCLLDDDIIVNPDNVSIIRKLDGKTLIYRPGVTEPDILPARSFEQLREFIFSGNYDAEYLLGPDDDEEEDEEDVDGEDYAEDDRE
ncbi:MAG: hypothetical protein LBE84_04220 [Planctomycetota bacterium]|jgi:hypothetical protein|nr:hypothetical protein [Planctomycetota bacterium]